MAHYISEQRGEEGTLSMKAGECLKKIRIFVLELEI